MLRNGSVGRPGRVRQRGRPVVGRRLRPGQALFRPEPLDQAADERVVAGTDLRERRPDADLAVRVDRDHDRRRGGMQADGELADAAVDRARGGATDDLGVLGPDPRLDVGEEPVGVTRGMSRRLGAWPVACRARCVMDPRADRDATIRCRMPARGIGVSYRSGPTTVGPTRRERSRGVGLVQSGGLRSGTWYPCAHGAGTIAPRTGTGLVLGSGTAPDSPPVARSRSSPSAWPPSAPFRTPLLPPDPRLAVRGGWPPS